MEDSGEPTSSEATSALVELENPDGAVSTQEKKRRQYERSTIGFPYGDLKDAAEVARVLRDHGGGQADMSQLAPWMHHDSMRSGAFRTKVATARMFGLIEVERDTVTLTALGRRIVDPTMEREARVTAFRNVPLFEKMFEQFKGHLLPPDAGLESEIVRMGVSQGQKEKARQVFQRSATQAGFFEHGRDRLVLPATNSYPNGATSQTISNAPERDELMDQPLPADTSLAPSSFALHPAIRGLFQAVPPAGSEWDSDDQEAWLEALRNVFRFVYKGTKRARQPE